MNLIKFIEKNLVKFLPSAKIEPKALHKAMRYSTLSGGKRIRPVILLETAITCGGEHKQAIAAACAVEFVHTYSLIHDDLPSMDNDNYRRGKPSCHKKFGEATAILAGDALLALAFNILAEEYPPSISVEMIKPLSLALGSYGMVGGQALDITKSKDLKSINRLKTSKLFEACAYLGAISAHAGKKEKLAIRKYGANLGMAFQSMDDIIDKQCHRGNRKIDRVISDSVCLINKAKSALNIFGHRANRLKAIADHVLDRKNNDTNNR